MTFPTPFGGVALTGRAPALHAGGWRFESARLHHSEGSLHPAIPFANSAGQGAWRSDQYARPPRAGKAVMSGQQDPL